jgi:DNA-directed RNA polymerase specialized sigma24 family protein
MANQIVPDRRIELQRLWEALLRLALSRGVPYQDAQDIVSTALRNALEHHDSSRGELLPFSRTILYNAVKNYWRDRKVDLPFEDE